MEGAHSKIDVKTASGSMDVYLHSPAGSGPFPTAIMYHDHDHRPVMQAPQLLLLTLPTDILRIIVSLVVLSPTSHITVRFVCRHFRNLVPPSPQQARQFCKLAAAAGYLDLIKWARANRCPWNGDTIAHA